MDNELWTFELNFETGEMMRVSEIEISSDASVYYLKEKILKEGNLNNLMTKDLTLMSNGRRLVDRASVAEIPELLQRNNDE